MRVTQNHVIRFRVFDFESEHPLIERLTAARFLRYSTAVARLHRLGSKSETRTPLMVMPVELRVPDGHVGQIDIDECGIREIGIRKC